MKMTKRLISLVLVLATLCSVLAITGSAASTNAYDILTSSCYAKTYTLATSGDTIPYTDASLTTPGTYTNGASSKAYIANSTDELYVKGVGCTNGKYWAFVSYPTSTRRVEAYIPLSAISVNNGTHAAGVSTGKFYCSTREYSANQSSYYVAKGDTVYLLGVYNNKYQIMYPVSGGKWRIAFCNADDYHTYVSSNVNRVAEGTYTIATALNTGRVLDISGGSKENGGNVQLYTKNNTNAQSFTVTYAGGGYYTIKNVGSGLVLDVAWGIASAGTNVQQYQSNSTDAQRWCFEDAGNGYFRIRSALGLYLDVNGGNSADGTNVQIWTANTTNAQKFKLNAKAGAVSSKISLNVPSYKQGDSRWSGTYISTKTIGQVGCLITSAAMVHSYKTGTTIYPDAMKNKLSFDGNCLIWSSLTNLGYSRTAYSNVSMSNAMMAKIYEQLKAGRPVIVGAYSATKDYSHWVVVTGYTGTSTTSFSASSFTINDPSATSRTTLAAFLSDFPAVEGMVY